MSGRRVALLVGIVAIAALAWWSWPRSHAAAPPDAAPEARPIVRPPVRVPDVSPPPAGSVRFALRDGKGGPVADADLTATPASGPTATATSAADGDALLAIGPGRWHLAVAGHRIVGADELELDGAIDRPLPLRLEADDGAAPPPPEDLGVADRSGGIAGVVTSGGAHLADVTVALTYLGGFGPGHTVVHDRAPHPIAIPARRFVGAATGFRWPDLPPGGYDVWIASPGQGIGHVHATVVAHGWGVASLDLAPAASLSGVVQDGRGVAVAGVDVHAELDGRVLAESVTAADGVYLLDDLPAGAVTVAARIAKDLCLPVSEPVPLEPGKRATHLIKMTCAWQGR